MEGECKIREKYNDHHYQDHVNGQGMEFYELMNGDFSQQLRIPKKFTDYYKRLPITVDLKGPSGSILPVGLHKTFDGVLLLHGWKEFVEAHNIRERDLLLFKYDGKFCFHISIFDESHCKKAPFKFFMVNKCEKERASQDSVEILNVNSPHNVNPCSSYDSFLQSPASKKTATSYHGAELGCKKGVNRRNEFPVHVENKKPKHSPDIDAHGRGDNIRQESVEICNGGRITNSNFFLRQLANSKIYMSRCKHLSGEDKERLSELVDGVQPSTPCLISFMAPYSVSNGCFMYIPAGFKKHLPPTKCPIFLQVPHERKKWLVNLTVSKSMTRFCWESFVLDNRLHLEDICLFELIEDELDITMTVHIQRAEGRNNSVSRSSDDTGNTTQHRNAPVSHKRASATRITSNNGCSCPKKFCTGDNIKQECDGIPNPKKLTRPNLYMPSRPLTDEEEKKALLLVDEVQPHGPSFIAFMGPYSVNRRKGSNSMRLTVPKKFAENCLPCQNLPILLQLPGSREKSCVRYTWEKDRWTIRSGWGHFVLANDLKQGDACLFMLTKKHPGIKMTVHIFRTATN